MRHRFRQFRDATTLPSPADYDFARTHLPGPMFDLFAAQHPRDIVHSTGTARWLISHGEPDPNVIAAALLHDIGKGPQRRVDRVAFVLAGHLGLAHIAAGRASRFELRRAIARSADHSESGARILAAAGASARVVNLTRFHHAPPHGDPVLALLQQADAAN